MRSHMVGFSQPSVYRRTLVRSLSCRLLLMIQMDQKPTETPNLTDTCRAREYYPCAHDHVHLPLNQNLLQGH